MVGDVHGQVRFVRVPRAFDADTAKAVSEVLQENLKDSRKILIATVGAVTGGTLQRLLLQVHRAREGSAQDSYGVAGLAVHARPATFAEWEAARASFHGKLMALWITYLPWRSVLEEELAMLDWLIDLPDDLEAFRTMRTNIIRHSIPDWKERCREFQPGQGLGNPRAAFWCAEQDGPSDELPHLLPTSRFGHNASMISALVGVGAIMQRSRLEKHQQGGPPWLQFDLTKIPISYFEAPILAAVLRWIHPHEACWSSESKDVFDIVHELRQRLQYDDSGSEVLVVGEMLLAAAGGKVPREVHDELRSWANDVVQSRPRESTLGIRTGLRLHELSQRHA